MYLKTEKNLQIVVVGLIPKSRREVCHKSRAFYKCQIITKVGLEEVCQIFCVKLRLILKGYKLYDMILRSFVLFSFFLFSLHSVAQRVQDVDDLSDAQVEQFVSEMQKRGLSDSEIEAVALANGYSSTDVSKMRERINKLKADLSQPIVQETVVSRQQLGELAERTVTQVETESEEEIKAKKVFGKDLFNNKNLTFQPNLRIPTPKDYILGVDDELNVDISGYAYQHYDVKVSPEGTIRFESLTPIYVNGLTIEEAKTKIVDRLKVLFGGLRNGSLTADVTLGNVRSIQVSILGEAEVPGTYTLSSFSKIFNALYLCGGPTNKGSFRGVKLIRNNKEIATLDLYNFLIRGISEGDQLLQDQDIIFIPIADRKVELEGEAKRTGIFELKPEETFKDLLVYAGGFSDRAFQESINITRNTAKEKKLFTVGQSSFDNQTLQDGDLVNIAAILDRYENKIEIVGAVFRPGEYALDESLNTLKGLIEKADGLREDAFLDRAILVRERDNLDQETNAVNLRDLMEGKISDIKLRRNDRLIVKSIVELREVRNVNISGAINIPGEYEFSENMTVNDLILMSGGFTDGATNKRIEIARRVFDDESLDKTVEVLDYVANKNLDNTEAVVLKPFDKVFIRELSNYEEQKTAIINGQVNYPGEYAIESRTERITDLIQKSGGLREEAFLNGMRYYRNGTLLAIDLEKVLKSNSDVGNLLVEDGDSLVIPKISGVVKVSGQVLNPTSVAYNPSYSFSDYIAQAGGYTDSAYVKKTFVRYANGLMDRTRSFWGIKNYPKVRRGMEVIVPERRKRKWSSAERIALTSALVSIASITATIIRLVN